jgi:hypothetical protein
VGWGGEGGERGVWFVDMQVPDTRRVFSAVKMNGKLVLDINKINGWVASQKRVPTL